MKLAKITAVMILVTLALVVLPIEMKSVAAKSSSARSWARLYGSTGDDYLTSIVQTSDGGYIGAGHSTSFSAGNFNIWVLRLDANGNILWQRTYGGSSGDDFADVIRQTADGGYIVGGDLVANSLQYGWMFKLDSSGNMQWQRIYGGVVGEFTEVHDIQQTSDGGYIVVGDSTPGDIPPFHNGYFVGWVLKLDSQGSIVWKNIYGKGEDFELRSVKQLADGGFIVGGIRGFFGVQLIDAWVFRLDESGNMVWQKAYTQHGITAGLNIVATSDGGFILGGVTNGVLSTFVAGNAYILKIDSMGNIQWQRVFGGTAGSTTTRMISQTPDGGYIAAGVTAAFGAGYNVVWVVRLGNDGSVLWQRIYGGTGDDRSRAVIQSSDGDFVVVGFTSSFSGSKGSSFAHDGWILKLTPGGTVPSCSFSTPSNGDNLPSALSVTVRNATVVTTEETLSDPAVQVNIANSSAQAMLQC